MSQVVLLLFYVIYGALTVIVRHILRNILRALAKIIGPKSRLPPPSFASIETSQYHPLKIPDRSLVMISQLGIFRLGSLAPLLYVTHHVPMGFCGKALECIYQLGGINPSGVLGGLPEFSCLFDL